MSERRERDWTDMTPGDFDRDAAPARRPGPRRPPRGGTPAEQDHLF
ncbi:hypothetical protein [Streptomyces prasinopilosus]|nr:hypothetical protein [Streptomyces prasinopilosus]